MSLLISGNTYSHRSTLSNLGGVFDSARRLWVFSSEQSIAAVRSAQPTLMGCVFTDENSPDAPVGVRDVFAHLNSIGISLGSFSTDDAVEAVAEALDIERIRLTHVAIMGETSPQEAERCNLLASRIADLLRRRPSARVTNENAAIPAAQIPAHNAGKELVKKASKRAAQKLQTENGFVVVAEGESAGSYIWIDASGEINLDALSVAWIAAGLPEEWLPKERTLAQTVKRALDAARQGQGERVTIEAVTRASEWAIVARKINAERSLDHTVLLIATADESKKVTFRNVHERGQALTSVIESAVAAGAGVLTRVAVSQWLIDRILPALGGMALRASGSVYYVPPGNVERLRAIKALLAQVSQFKLILTPVVKCDDVMEAILGGASLEAEAIISKIAEDLDNGEVASKTKLKNREAALVAAKERVSAFERMMGASLGGIHDKLNLLRNKLATAVVKVGGAIEGAAPAQDAADARIALIVGENRAEAQGSLGKGEELPEVDERDARFSSLMAEVAREDRKAAAEDLAALDLN